jgi:hypothetical protein
VTFAVAGSENEQIEHEVVDNGDQR